MISRRKNFLFVHVPKTGGNSIQRILKEYSEDEIVASAEHQDGIERFGVRNRRYNTTKHTTLSRYKASLDVNTYSSLFKFAAIRNPWDMMISYYFSPHRGVTEWDRDSFIRLVNRTRTIRHYVRENTFVAKVLSGIGVRRTVSAERLDSDLDALIRFEHLDDDFKAVCKHLCIPYAQLPKTNSSIRKNYSLYYDDELRRMVGKKFAEEARFGNYSF